MCWWFFSMIFRDGFFFIIPTTVDIYLSYYAVYFCYRWCYILLLFFIQENLLVIVGTLISLLIFFFQFLLQLFDAAAVFSKLFMFRKNWLCLLVHSYRLFIFVLLSPMLLLTAGSGFCCQFMSIWNCRCLLIFSAPFCCHFVSSWHFCWHCFRYFLLFAADFLYCFCCLFEKISCDCWRLPILSGTLLWWSLSSTPLLFAYTYIQWCCFELGKVDLFFCWYYFKNASTFFVIDYTYAIYICIILSQKREVWYLNITLLERQIFKISTHVFVHFVDQLYL